MNETNMNETTPKPVTNPAIRLLVQRLKEVQGHSQSYKKLVATAQEQVDFHQDAVDRYVLEIVALKKALKKLGHKA